MDQNDAEVEAEGPFVPEANLETLSNYNANQDIARVEAAVEVNIGKASDGKL